VYDTQCSIAMDKYSYLLLLFSMVKSTIVNRLTTCSTINFLRESSLFFFMRTGTIAAAQHNIDIIVLSKRYSTSSKEKVLKC